MQIIQSFVYMLCFLTCFAAMLLLLQSFRRNGSRLLLWSVLAFIALAINNLILFVDIVLLPDISLLPLRELTAFAGVAILLYGFIWEVD